MRILISILKFVFAVAILVAGTVTAIKFGMPVEIAGITVPSIMSVLGMLLIDLRVDRKAEIDTFMNATPQTTGILRKFTGNEAIRFVAFGLILSSLIFLTSYISSEFTASSAKFLEDIEGSQAADVRFILNFSDFLTLPMFGIWCGFLLKGQSDILSDYRNIIGFAVIGVIASFIYDFVSAPEYMVRETKVGDIFTDFRWFVSSLFLALFLFIVSKSVPPRKITRQILLAFMLFVIMTGLVYSLLWLQNRLGGMPIFIPRPENFSFFGFINSILNLLQSVAHLLITFWMISFFFPISEKAKSFLLILFSLAIGVTIIFYFITIYQFIFDRNEYYTFSYFFDSTVVVVFEVLLFWFLIIDLSRPGLVKKPYQSKNSNDPKYTGTETIKT